MHYIVLVYFTVVIDETLFDAIECCINISKETATEQIEVHRVSDHQKVGNRPADMSANCEAIKKALSELERAIGQIMGNANKISRNRHFQHNEKMCQSKMPNETIWI